MLNTLDNKQNMKTNKESKGIKTQKRASKKGTYGLKITNMPSGRFKKKNITL